VPYSVLLALVPGCVLQYCRVPCFGNDRCTFCSYIRLHGTLFVNIKLILGYACCSFIDLQRILFQIPGFYWIRRLRRAHAPECSPREETAGPYSSSKHWLSRSIMCKYIFLIISMKPKTSIWILLTYISKRS